MALYSACTGNNHAWQESTNSIGAISYLVVQAYEALSSGRGNQFRSLLSSLVKTRADRGFLHIPGTQFLCRLQHTPVPIAAGKLALSETDFLVFQKLAGSSQLRENLANVIKELNKATRKKKTVAK